jgi:hypothetical protein
MAKYDRDDVTVANCKRPPALIDGARVLAWAWSDKPFGFVKEGYGKPGVAIHGLAIVQYHADAKVYRLSCDMHWECVADFDYDSVEQAQMELSQQYGCAEVQWHLWE